MSARRTDFVPRDRPGTRSKAGRDVRVNLLPDDPHPAPRRVGIKYQLISLEPEIADFIRADEIGKPTSLHVVRHRLSIFIDCISSKIAEVAAPGSRLSSTVARRQSSLANLGCLRRASC